MKQSFHSISRSIISCWSSAIIAGLSLLALVALPGRLEASPSKTTPKSKEVVSKKTPVKSAKISKGPVAQPKPAAAQASNQSAGPLLSIDQNMKNLPTYIKSDNLTVNNKERTFAYSGNVEVTQGDLNLTAELLDGTYDEKNQIKDLTARRNVIIVKGDGIRASGEKAIYDRASDTLVLTESPELKQGESILTADRIRIFLKENRSVAEGQVRVKVVRSDSKGGGSPLSLESLKR